ncbi:hypothetical protein MTO96_024922 [Rhipicephalus appendiculatus]
MPSIVLFRRRWIIANDDLYLPPLLEAICRLGWLVASGMLLWEHRPLWLCGDSDWLSFAYQLGAQVFCLLVIGSDLALAAINSRGAIVAVRTFVFADHMSLNDDDYDRKQSRSTDYCHSNLNACAC